MTYNIYIKYNGISEETNISWFMDSIYNKNKHANHFFFAVCFNFGFIDSIAKNDFYFRLISYIGIDFVIVEWLTVSLTFISDISCS